MGAVGEAELQAKPEFSRAIPRGPGFPRHWKARCVSTANRNGWLGFDGHLTQAVKFGFGLLGHSDTGGHFEVRQAEVVPGHWDMTTLSLQMTGKALLFATIGAEKRENHRDFHRVADDLTLTQAADILNRTMVVADNR